MVLYEVEYLHFHADQMDWYCSVLRCCYGANNGANIRQNY